MSQSFRGATVTGLLAQRDGAKFCIHPHAIKKNAPLLSTYGQTPLSCASLQKQGDVGQLRYKWFPCTQKEKTCFSLIFATVRHPPPSLTALPKGLRWVHRVLLVLRCQRHNIGVWFHHGSMWRSACHLYLSAQIFSIGFTVV